MGPTGSGPVATTSSSDLSPGRVWTIKQTLHLLAQGYPVVHVAQVTGYDRRWVAAHAIRIPRTSIQP